MRESFSVLDRNNAGSIDRSDVEDMLTQLGLDASPASLNAYFPRGGGGGGGGQHEGSVNLATYLNSLAADFTRLSGQEELLAAFAAFDDGDDGQVSLQEIVEAVGSSMGEGSAPLSEREVGRVVEGFSGRRAFGGKGVGSGLGGKREEVFRYREFVGAVCGGGGAAAGGAIGEGQVG